MRGVWLTAGTDYLISGKETAAQIKKQIDSAFASLKAVSYTHLLPLSGYIIIANMLLQTIGKSGKASLLSLARQGLFFLPAIFLFPALLGLTGVPVSYTHLDVYKRQGSNA